VRTAGFDLVAGVGEEALVSIELLWLIPVIALALTLPMIIRSFQLHRPANDDSVLSQTRELTDEVEKFNQGVHLTTKPAGQRAGEIENIITLVSAALSNQQKIIETFKGKDDTVAGELNNLKSKLHELQQEYDIVTSENYSLRARIGKLLQERDGQAGPAMTPEEIESARSLASASATSIQTGEPDTPAAQEAPRYQDFARQYGDTRTFRQTDLDDTSEINIGDLR
jgi:hypothetical protein